VHLAVESVGPDMRPGYGIDKLPREAETIAAAADATLKHVSDIQLAPDLTNINRLALVGKRRISGNNEQPIAARQCGDDFFRHAIGKIFLLGIAAHVGERQHRDGRIVRRREGRPLAGVLFFSVRGR
jgi:hypothetical protein